MSKSTPPPELVEAYTLLKMGQRIEAGNLLKRYLATNPHDVNAWWLLSHTVGKPDQIKKCLQTVLRIDPDHAKARAKLAELEAAEAPEPPPAPAPEPEPAPDTALDEPLPWQQQPAGSVSSGSVSPFTSASDTWEPPEVSDPFAGQAPPPDPTPAQAASGSSVSGSSVLDEEPDDSLFFGTLKEPTAKRKSKRRASKRKSQSRVVQPLEAPPAADPPSPAPPPPPPPATPELSPEMLAAAFPLPEASSPDTPTGELFGRSSAEESSAGSFSEFVATARIERDPFSGQPVNDPFADFAAGDDPFAEQDAATMDISGTPAAAAPRATNTRTAGDQILLLVVGVFAVLVLISFVLFALDEGGTISLDIFSESTPEMTTLSTATFAIDYPGNWNQRCATESLGYEVCGIANHALYNEVDWFAGQEIDIGAMISAAFGSPFGTSVPDEQVSIIVMDVPTSSYAYDDSSWAKTQYEYYQNGWVWDTNATIEYNGREDIIIDGYTAYYYKYTSVGTFREAAWDVYIPHDGVVFWLRATFYGERGDRIPQNVIDAMIDSIDINPA